MANDEELKVVITAQIDSALKQFIAFANAFDDLIKVTKQLTGQFSALSTGIGKFDQEVGKASAQTKKFVATTGNANTVMTNLGRIASDLPFGFIAIQNNLDPLIQSLGELFSRTKKEGPSAFKQLASSMLGAGGIGLAFSITSALATKLIQEYGSLSAAYQALTTNVTYAQRAQQAYNKSATEAEASIGGEIAKITALLSVAKDETISRDQREKAIKQLQKEYPGYLKNIDLENVNSEAAATAIDRLTEALIRKAKVQAAADLITKETQKLLTAQNTSVINQASAWALLADNLASGITGIPRFTAQIASGVKTQQKAISDSQSAIDGYQKKMNELLKQDALAKVIGISEKGKKEGKTASDILKELQKELTGLDAAFAAVGGSLSELSQDKIRSIADALKELASIGVLPGSDIFNALQTQIKALQSTLVKTPITFKIPIVIEPLEATTNDQTVKRVMDGVSQSFRKQLDPFTNQVNEIIRSSTTSGIESLATGVGEALVSGDFSEVTQGFVNAISNFLSQLGKLLIVQGVAVQAFQTSLKTLQGIPAIIAGGALVAAAAAFRSLASSGVPAFATGGSVYGPTLAMIGDNPGREEHIIPSEVLDKMQGGWNMPERIELFLSGVNATRIFERGKSYTKRVNG